MKFIICIIQCNTYTDAISEILFTRGQQLVSKNLNEEVDERVFKKW